MSRARAKLSREDCVVDVCDLVSRLDRLLYLLSLLNSHCFHLFGVHHCCRLFIGRHDVDPYVLLGLLSGGGQLYCS